MGYGGQKDTPALMRSVTPTLNGFEPRYSLVTGQDQTGSAGGARYAARREANSYQAQREPMATGHDVIIPTAGDDEDELTLTRNPFPALAATWQMDAAVAGRSSPPTALATVPRSERRLRDTADSPAPRRVEWYVRLKLRQDLLGKLWARNLMPRDVLVWSQDQQHWLRLEEVPRLRSYVSAAVRDWERREKALPARSSSVPAPPIADHIADARRDVVFRPTGMAARHLASTIPPPSQGAAGFSVPVAPRVPSFDEVLGGTQRAEAFAASELSEADEARGLAALTHSSVVPPRLVRTTIPPPASERLSGAAAQSPSSLPAPRTVAIPSPLVQPHRGADRPHSSGVDYVERLVWMVAGVATMFAVMAALGKIRRSDLWREPASVADLVPALGSMVSARFADMPGLRQLAAARVEPAESQEVTAPPDREDTESSQDTAAEADSDDADGDESRRSEASGRSGRRWGRAIGRRAPEPADEKSASETQHVDSSEPAEPTKSQAQSDQTAPRGLGSFDRTAARRALAGAAARAAKCARSAASGTVVVTYASSGLVQNVTVAELSGLGVSESCVARSFQSARVTPYFGGSVTVRKSFSVK